MRRIRRFLRKIRRIFEYLPVIWKNEDFDHHYIFTLLKYKLERTKKSFKESKIYDHSINIQKIETAIRLLDIVIEEQYVYDIDETFCEILGKDVKISLNFYPDKDDPELFGITLQIDGRDMTEEEEELYQKVTKECYKKQRRAQRVLFEFLDHNIQSWWD